MKSTKSNLLIFVIANADYGNGVVTCHSKEGKHRLKTLVKEKAQINLIQARFFKTRRERWEYLLKKCPDLQIINNML